ncbi:hypothetical protein Nepgr_032727 [Nepenthes gracilis]|uniref:Bet v I/Major latex protein domain-containing protein n=1 Tax=Nepenthes gracilis TaxID=150966 RepID=A0AAD3Y836_NEPGR|nr:hypothetical protein Nepgr_032727 [Nepenthes gracilis]
MAATTFTMEVDCATAPARLFKGLCLDSHNLYPKLLPNIIKSVEFIQGDCNTVGSVKKLYFPEGFPYKYGHHRIDELDVANSYVKYTTTEGDVIQGRYEYVVHETKIVASGTGSVCKFATEFALAPGAALNMEEEIKVAKERTKKVIKTVDEYLIANPQAYA